jgi:hypothetical protein
MVGQRQVGLGTGASHPALGVWVCGRLDEHAFWPPCEAQIAECAVPVVADEHVDLAGAG